MIQLLDNISVGMVRVAPNMPDDTRLIGAFSATIRYSSVEYVADDKIASSVSLSSAPYSSVGTGKATEFKDMKTKIVRTDTW